MSQTGKTLKKKALVEDAIEREIVLTRVLDAPRERVWKAWSEPEQLKAWFGPKGFETFHARLDFRSGGTYHYGMRNAAGGVDMWGKWTFREIAAPSRADVGGKTLITILWSPYEATEAEIQVFREGFSSMNQGWTGTFERLDAHLKEER